MKYPYPDSKLVLVVGAGAAGMAAAVSAARNGANAIVIDAARFPGGTVRACLIHTLGGFFDNHGELLNDGLSAELIERLVRTDPLARKRKIGRLWTLTITPQNSCPRITGCSAISAGTRL